MNRSEHVDSLLLPVTVCGVGAGRQTVPCVHCGSLSVSNSDRIKARRAGQWHGGSDMMPVRLSAPSDTIRRGRPKGISQSQSEPGECQWC